MKAFRSILQRFFEETAAKPGALRRVGRRVVSEQTDREFSRMMLGQLPEPAPGAAGRVRARLQAGPPQPRPVRVWLPAGALVAACVAGLLAVIALRPAPDQPVMAELRSDGAWSELQPSEEVALRFQGEGALQGSQRVPRIIWEAGSVRIQVQPEQGIDLHLSTPEAQVRVVGTVFTVTRDALGTRVAVERGRVRVDCVEGGQVLLDSGQDQVCLPISAAGLLARVRMLQDQGASAEDQLVAADKALALGDASEAVQGELQLVRMQALAQLDRPEEALAEAERYLGSAHPLRQEDVRRLAARLAWNQGGCAAALPHLEQLLMRAPDITSLVQLADCLAADEPARAREALQAALAQEPTAADEDAIRLRLEGLGG